MNTDKKVLMAIPMMKGGGAEKVAALLLNKFQQAGFSCEYLLTSSRVEDSVVKDLAEDVTLSSLSAEFKESTAAKFFYTLLRFFSSLMCKPLEFSKIPVPAFLSYLSFISQYHREIKALRQKLIANPDMTVIAFLQPSIPITLLAARGLDNKIIISERCDPVRLMKHRYGYHFIKKYYSRANACVFQTEDAKNTYPENIAEKGTVIFNPINSSLPQPYFGNRNKNITTFCRISYQKNLPVLIEAFAQFHKNFGDYRLRIIGNTNNESDEKALAETKDKINELNIGEYVDFLPFSKTVHEEIIQDAMYINSSDYEGMSNAMLEAMAIGMPVVCTDCPIGGAAAVINSGENGLLAEVGNSKQICAAMEQIASDKNFSDKLSENAAEIRTKLSLENIAKQWMELL